MRNVVLVSGGIDSYVAYHYSKVMNDTTAMFVDYGQPYIEKEHIAISALFKNEKLVSVNCDLCTPELENVPTLEKQEIYGRNLLLCFYGATIGDNVWLSSLATEMNVTSVRDKHPEFFLMTSALLTYIFKSKRNETIVETPFKFMTKSDVVALGLSLGITKEQLKETSSCYHEQFNNCGMCSTCFKRWIAMVNNEIEESYVYPPWDNEYARGIIHQAQLANLSGGTERFSMQRIKEMSKALKTVDININI